MNAQSESGFDYGVLRNVMVSMRDGIRLASDIYFPRFNDVKDGNRSFSVILIRTPYTELPPMGWLDTAPHYFTSRGYATVVQKARGTNHSEGEFEPLENESWGERQDGADTMSWILQQSWCNGKIATYGPSYLGAVQLLLTTQGISNYETAFVESPAVARANFSWIFHRYTFDLQTASFWTIMMLPVVLAKRPELLESVLCDERELGFSHADIAVDPSLTLKLLAGRSLRDALVLRHVPFWQHWLDSRDDPAAFANVAIHDRWSRVSKPLMHLNGWYDLFIQNSVDAYVGISANGATKSAREGQRLWLGPWGHMVLPHFREFPESEVDDLAAATAWFDQQLAGAMHPIFDHNVLLYVMGENRWRAEVNWPLPDAQPTSFYLNSSGSANSCEGDGMLTVNVPSYQSGTDSYFADPADPVPTLGGRGLFAGPVAQSMNDGRRDVLAYTTEILQEDVEVTGCPVVTLYASSSATDTDWFVTLIDVLPTEEGYNLCAGNIRARYRQSRTEPSPLCPGEVVKYRIELSPTSIVFKKGHRIRLVVSSSDYPSSDLNSNCFMDLSLATPSDYVVAKQVVHHGQSLPSCIELPIIPADRERHWVPAPFAKRADGTYYLQTVDVKPVPKPTELNEND